MRKPYTFNRFAITIVSVCLMLLLPSAAQTQLVQQFAFSCKDARMTNCPQGSSPKVFIQASDGNFYGAAQRGGAQDLGTIFRLSTSNHLTLLHSFIGTDGSEPGSTLVEAPDGTLWGATLGGGQFGMGVVFKVGKNGSGFKVVQNFTRDFATDFLFSESLVVGRDGNIYGTTVGGGFFDQNRCPYGCGMIFRINPRTGALQTLHVMQGTTADGSAPSGLVQASDGNFYGVSTGGVFRITPNGTLEILTTLSGFPYVDSTDGGSVGVIQASSGKLVGIIQDRQVSPAVYQLNLDGSGLQVFPGILAQQFADAVSNLLQAADGSLWFTSYGNNADKGAVVQVSSQDGSLLQNILFDLLASNGANPSAPLIQTRDGQLFGTTAFGGTAAKGTADGVVFNVSGGGPNAEAR